MEKRIIPVLLLHNKGLIKSTRFKNYNYIGDPINAVKIFNDKEVDELVFLDIDASKEKRGPDFALIESIASECFIPFAYGGGIRTMADIRKLFSIGAEKAILNTGILDDLSLVTNAASESGSQSIVVCIDIKRNLVGTPKVYNHVTKKILSEDVASYASRVVAAGAGEIILNDVDREGTYRGFDTKLVNTVASAVGVPVICCGGASSHEDLFKILKETSAEGAAAGSVFVYHGPLKGVLINYPTRKFSI